MSKIRLHGSSSGYTEIAPVAASGNNTLTLPNDGTIISKDANGAVGVTSVHTTNITATGIATITTAKIGAGVTITESGIEASGIGITCASINGTQIGGRRNIIINGAMQVAQRGTSNTTNNGYGTVDRFALYAGNTDEAVTQSQADVSSGTTPYTSGFRKSFKLTNGNQTSGAGAADYVGIEYYFEAQDIANSGWNYTSASSFITLQFWVKSSVAQNFYGYFVTQDGTVKMYPIQTGSLSADTWTKITKTIPGHADLQFDNNVNTGLILLLIPFYGTNYTSSSVSLNAWKDNDGAARMPDNTSTWYTTNDATFEITGVQLEVGSQATPFEHRSIGEEMKLCERYYEKSYNHSVVPGTATDDGMCMFISNRSNGAPHTMLRFRTTKRANPTMTCFNPEVTDNNNIRDVDSGSNLSALLNRTGENGCTVYHGGNVALGQFLSFHYTAAAEL